MAQRLRVTIVAARNLLAADSGGTSDPYAILTFNDLSGRQQTNGALKKQTEKVLKTLNPVWNAEYVFDNFPAANTSAIHLELRDYNKFSKGDPLGDATIPMSSIDATGGVEFEQWIPLEKAGKMRTVSGDVQVRVRLENAGGSSSGLRTSSLQDVSSAGGGSAAAGGAEGGAAAAGGDEEQGGEESAAAAGPAQPNELVVTLVQARGVRIMDRTTSDPLCYLKIVGQSDRKKSTTKKKTLAPNWNETFKFSVTDPNANLEILMEDEDTLRNDFMGKVNIPLANLQAGVEAKSWYTLLNDRLEAEDESRGEVEVKLLWRFNRLAASPSSKKKGGLFSKMGVSMKMPGLGGGASDDEISDEDAEGQEATEEPEAPKTAEEIEEEKKAEEEARNALMKELGDIEIKDGDYTLQVHIIEVRDLKAEDVTGLSDPIVYIEAFGQKYNTVVKEQCLSAVFDEVFIFQLRKLDKETVQNATIKLNVMDADTLSRNDPIGAYTFDASYVYAQKDHEVYRRWLALTDDTNPDDHGIQGYLKCSIAIVGPGEKFKVHDQQADAKEEKKAEAEKGGLGGLVMMPPAVQQQKHFLVTTLHRAEDLPPLDTALVGRGGIDAFVTVNFAGNDPLKSNVKSKKGAQKDLKVSWNQQLWSPVTIPTMTNTISLSVWDWDRIGTNDCVAHAFESFKVIQAMPGKKLGPKWVNLYGAPLGLMGPITTMKDKMNRNPDIATTYRGRVLVTFRVDENDDGEEEQANHKKKAPRLKPEREPPTRLYTLRALVIRGSEIPRFKALMGVGRNKKMQIRVKCGLNEILTERRENADGIVEWFELQETTFEFPEDLDQVPDIFVYLCTGDEKSLDYISFARFKAKDLAKENFMGDAKWLSLREDDAKNMLDDDEFPGSVLIRLGFGPSEAGAAAMADWRSDVTAMTAKQAYQVRVHVYQARDLPAADSNGKLDPFLKVKFMGKESKTNRLLETTAPLWYETLTFDVQLPPIEFAPRVCLQLFDWDRFDKDDYCGSVYVPLQDAVELASPTDPLPDPKWYPFFLQAPGDGGGEVLVSVQIISKTPGAVMPERPNIEPDMREAFLEIVALGLRDMKPFNFIGMQDPFCEFEMATKNKGKSVGSVRAATDISHKPSGANPNFLERIVLPVMLPINSLFAPRLSITARDTRLGGFSKPIVGSASIDMQCKLPWDVNYVPPQAQMIDTSDLAAKSGAVVVSEAGLGLPAASEAEGAEEEKGESAPLLGGGEARRASTVASAGASAAAAKELSIEEQIMASMNAEAAKLAQGQPATSARSGAVATGDLLSLGDPLTQPPAAGAAAAVVPTDSSAAAAAPAAPVGLAATSGAPSTRNLGEKSLDDMIREKAGDVDTGAGVFGALLHVEKKAGKRGHAAGDDEEADGSEEEAEAGEGVDWENEEEEIEEPKYMKDREVWQESIEERLKSTPFETYELHLGQKFGGGLGGGDFRVSGRFKGLIRVMLTKDEPCLFDVKELLKPNPYLLRLYVLKGVNFTPMDPGIGGRPGKSDPYLIVKLGKTKINDRKNYIDDTTDPMFYKCFEITSELPGESQLTIDAMDADLIGSDDLIGRTVIDLEDRWFDQRWQALGAGFAQDSVRLAPKPVETRTLFVPTSSAPQGQMQLWLDILTPADAGAYPADDVALPPVEIYEVRVIVWKTRDVVAMDDLTGMNDMFAKVWIEGLKPQETDTHWRCKNGKGSFNWRMKFNVELGVNTMAFKFPYFHIQLWDKDILKWNDCIAEGMMDLGRPFKSAMKNKAMIQVFDDAKKPGGKKKAAKAKAEAEAKAKAEAEAAAAAAGAEESKEGDPLLAAEAGEAGADPFAAKGMARKSVKLLDPPEESGGFSLDKLLFGDAAAAPRKSVAAAGGGEAAAPAPAAKRASTADPAKAPLAKRASAADLAKEREAARKKKEEEKNKMTFSKAVIELEKMLGISIPLIGKKSQQANAKKAKEAEKKAKKAGGSKLGAGNPKLTGKEKAEADKKEAQEFIDSIKAMTGLFDVDPPNAHWLRMERMNFEIHEKEHMGDVCISIEVHPKEKADQNPAGFGRSEPNANPFLPPPTGRLKFSMNPFTMLSQLMGPGLTSGLFCCCACAACMLLLIFCQPVLNLMIALFC